MRTGAAAWIALVAACSHGTTKHEGDDEAKQACDARVASIAKWETGPIEGLEVSGRVWLDEHGTAGQWSAVAEHGGWRPLPITDIEVGVVVEPNAIRTTLPEPQLGSARLIYVVADARAPLRLLGEVSARYPDAVLRLVVRKPAEDLRAPFYAAFPNTPTWARTPIDRAATSNNPLAQLIPALQKAGEGCDGIRNVLALIRSGGGPDILAPALAEALTDCRCRAADLDALEALMAQVSWGQSPVGWVPASFAERDEALANLHLDDDATVSKLVAAIGSLGAARWDDAWTAAPASEPPASVPISRLSELRISGETQIVPPELVKTAMENNDESKLVTTVKLCVSTAGDVYLVKLLKSSGYRAYDDAIQAAVRDWKYRPFLVDDEPVNVCTSTTFIYRRN